jgi:hypothetical protein
MDSLRELWAEIQQESRKQQRSVFQVSSLMAMSAVTHVPQKARWLSTSAQLAVRKTGVAVGGLLLDDYRDTLNQIRKTGYVRYAARQFRPYLFAAISQFSPRRKSLTEKLLGKRRAPKPRGHELPARTKRKR